MTRIWDFPAYALIARPGASSFAPARCQKGGWKCGPACPERQQREWRTPAYLRGRRTPGFGTLGPREKIR
jgi:hypothetical protein